ncbi:unnamed protein product, partial [Callosobruchus maculatus]
MPEKRQNIQIDCLRNVDGKTYPALREQIAERFSSQQDEVG